jgi:uncharacterized protein (TIGR03089 family)
MQQRDVWHLLTHLPQPEQPFITVINADGRVELSGRTLVNGISKAANALCDIIEVDPGELIDIDLGWNWQQSVWQGAALIAGLHLVKHSENVGINIPDHRIDTEVVSVHPLGLPHGGEHEITAQVLGQPDTWLYPQPWPQQAELLDRALSWAVEMGIEAGDRVGVNTSQLSEATADHIRDYGLLLMPLCLNASVVIMDGVQGQCDSIVEQERITRLL